MSYKIILVVASSFLLKATTIAQLLSYLRKLGNMNNQRWPKIAMNEDLVRRRKTKMKQNISG